MILVLPGHFIIIIMSDIKTRNRLISMFVDKGYTQNQAIGIVANLQAESGFRTKAHGDRGLVKGGSHGIAQWNRERLDKLKEMYGDGWDKLENQVAYVDWELRNTEKVAGDALRKARTIEEATRIFTTEYERPKDKHLRANERIKIAMSYKDIIPESYTPEATQTIDNETFKKQEPIVLGLTPKGGSLESAPEISEEQKTDFAKLDIIQSQLNTLLSQQKPQTAQQPQLQQTVQPTVDTTPTFDYLLDSNLFKIQDENI